MKENIINNISLTDLIDLEETNSDISSNISVQYKIPTEEERQNLEKFNIKVDDHIINKCIEEGIANTEYIILKTIKELAYENSIEIITDITDFLVYNQDIDFIIMGTGLFTLICDKLSNDKKLEMFNDINIFDNNIRKLGKYNNIDLYVDPYIKYGDNTIIYGNKSEKLNLTYNPNKIYEEYNTENKDIKRYIFYFDIKNNQNIPNKFYIGKCIFKEKRNV